MVEAGTEECNVNKDCPAGRFCDVHTCRACLHAGASCHFIGEKSRTLFTLLRIRHFKKFGSSVLGKTKQEIVINIKDTQVEPYSILMIGVNINRKLSFVDHICEVF